MVDTKTKDEMADGATIYEVSYLLLPSISSEQTQGKAIDLKAGLEKAGAGIISDENPVLIDLAYPMTKVVGTVRHKCDSGYFGWVKFEMSPDTIGSVKKMLDNNDEILRYLIIKTVKENTLLNGKMNLKKDNKSQNVIVPTDEIIEDVPAINPEVVVEDLDKSIEDLVIV